MFSSYISFPNSSKILSTSLLTYLYVLGFSLKENKTKNPKQTKKSRNKKKTQKPVEDAVACTPGEGRCGDYLLPAPWRM